MTMTYLVALVVLGVSENLLAGSIAAALVVIHCYTVFKDGREAADAERLVDAQRKQSNYRHHPFKPFLPELPSWEKEPPNEAL